MLKSVLFGAVLASTVSLTSASAASSLDKWYLRDCTNSSWADYQAKHITDVYNACGAIPTANNTNDTVWDCGCFYSDGRASCYTDQELALAEGAVCATSKQDTVTSWLTANVAQCPTSSCSVAIGELQVDRCFYRYLYGLSGAQQEWVQRMQLMCRGLHFGLFLAMLLSALAGAPLLLLFTGHVMIPAGSNAMKVLAPIVSMVEEQMYGPRVKSCSDLWNCVEQLANAGGDLESAIEKVEWSCTPKLAYKYLLHIYFVYRSFNYSAQKTRDFFTDVHAQELSWEKEVTKQLRSSPGFEQYNATDWLDIAHNLGWGFGNDDADQFNHIIKFEIPTNDGMYKK